MCTDASFEADSTRAWLHVHGIQVSINDKPSLERQFQSVTTGDQSKHGHQRAVFSASTGACSVPPTMSMPHCDLLSACLCSLDCKLVARTTQLPCRHAHMHACRMRAACRNTDRKFTNTCMPGKCCAHACRRRCRCQPEAPTGMAEAYVQWRRPEICCSSPARPAACSPSAAPSATACYSLCRYSSIVRQLMCMWTLYHAQTDKIRGQAWPPTMQCAPVLVQKVQCMACLLSKPLQDITTLLVLYQSPVLRAKNKLNSALKYGPAHLHS